MVALPVFPAFPAVVLMLVLEDHGKSMSERTAESVAPTFPNLTSLDLNSPIKVDWE